MHGDKGYTHFHVSRGRFLSYTWWNVHIHTLIMVLVYTLSFHVYIYIQELLFHSYYCSSTDHSPGTI